VKTREIVTLVQELPITLWRDGGARERCWAEMRAKLSQSTQEARPGWSLADAQEDRHVLYMRNVTGLDGEAKTVECMETQADFARLRLSCWAALQ
jgi:hypothetical protein